MTIIEIMKVENLYHTRQISLKRAKSSNSSFAVGFLCSSKLNIARIATPYKSLVEKAVDLETIKSATF